MSNKNKKAECVRRVANWSKIEAPHRFDKKTFNKSITRDDITQASPKLQALFDKIKELDAEDMKNDGRVYKHMIYSDVKTLGYGAKIIASAFIASGFTPAYDKDFQVSETQLAKTPYKNFAVLCSTPVYEKPITVKLKTSVLQTYNNRPDNVHGKNLRFLILDQGYKEGIDVFDIKYIHLFEPTITRADEKQAIGRGTRMCGQKGLKFHREKGWIIHVFRYNSTLPDDSIFKNQPTTHDLFIELSGLNSKLITFANELDKLCVIGAVDHDLTKNIHSFQLTDKTKSYELPRDIERELFNKDESSPKKSSDLTPVPPPIEKFILYGREYYKGQPIKCKEGCKGVIPVPTSLMLIAWMVTMKSREPFYTKRPRAVLCRALVDNKVYCDTLNLIWQDPHYFISTYKSNIRIMLGALSKDRFVFADHLKAIAMYISEELQKMKNKEPPPPPIPTHMPPASALSFGDMRTYIQREFGDYTWEKIDIRNQCALGGAPPPTIMDFTPTQKFIKDYFQPSNPYKGMLLHASTGSGKTCTAIATATNSFEKEGYTILWVTRHTLKSDIWKNMFGQVCSIVLQEKINEGLQLPEELTEKKKLLSENWIEPISYKQFSNFLKGKNKKLSELIVSRNGAEDPLHKTLIIIDEAHKLYAPDVSGSERPDVAVLRKMIHKSYRKSGQLSCRVLLMSATPYTSDPMDMIKLLNYLRKDTEQLPETFDEFKAAYLDNRGEFTKTGTVKFLQDITGYISYLNRENDIRQFAYPVISDILVPISKTPSFVSQQRRVEKLQEAIQKYSEVLTEDIPKVMKETKELYEKEKSKCIDLSTTADKTRCKERAKQHYQDAVNKIKERKETVTSRKKELKDELREKKKDLKESKEKDISQETVLKEDCLQ